MLAHGSILLLTSHSTRSSPVLRGKWILDNLLNSPPAAPPANVLPLDESRKLTAREQVERHRANPVCASCHDRIDPLGFALENYDAISRWRRSAIPLGIAGGIKVEASPWVEDNLWVMMVIESEPMLTGMIGNLDPVKPEFREYLERYHRNKLFLGIRYGNVWGNQNLVTAVDNPDFIANMKVFAQTGLTLEVANPRLDLMEATVRLTDKVPELRVVLGHLQALAFPTDNAVLKSYSNNLKELRQRNTFVKSPACSEPARPPTRP